MNVSTAQPPAAGAAAAVEASRAPTASHAAGGFAHALAGQQQLDAAKAVLATLPAPIVYTLRDHPGSPAEAVDRLFEVLKDGSFQPPEGPLGAPGSIIGATAHAATLFDTPAQLWDAMRQAIGDPAALAAALRSGAAPASRDPTSEPGPAPVVRNLEDAERLLGATRPSMPNVDWWEAALRFLLGADFPA